MWICVAYFKIAQHAVENHPVCALFKNDGQFRVVYAANDKDFQQYDGTDTDRFSQVVAARPKAVFANTYVLSGDISVTATVLESGIVVLPSIEESSPSAAEKPL